MANLMHDVNDKIREIIKNEGITGVQRFVQESRQVFKIAVIGTSGSGKSSLINILCGLKHDDVAAASVDVVETTKDVKEYIHPENENLHIFDLPGIGTPNLPKRQYLSSINLSQYDFFLILSAGRFTENDLFLASEVKKLGKTFYFVRSKVDVDLRNEKRMRRDRPYNEQNILSKIREHTIYSLERSDLKTCDVFLVDNYDSTKYDFPRLSKTILKDAPLIKIGLREHILSSLVIEVFAKNKEFAKIKSGAVATQSMLVRTNEVPQTPIYVDAKCIMEETEAYKQLFSLQEHIVADYAATMNMSLRDLEENLYLKTVKMDFSETEILNACAELYPSSKINFPLVGSVLSSRSVVKAYLGRIIDQMADDGIKLHMALISRKRNAFFEASSSCV